ncbi:MAG: dienelactone hydrolase [Paenibacillus sp.]|jgi:dienelactone hydrolase|nr:dienelactone hydrolase [Paenibacillus sp.]
MWNPDTFLDDLYDRATRESLGASRKSWNERKSEVRSKLLESLGSFPVRSVELNPVNLERIDRGDYILERVVYSTDINLRVPAYVLIPKGLRGRAPAVLAWHGHGYGSREIVGLQPDGTVDESQPGIHQHFAVQLVKRGMVVIAPEIIGFGDRRMSADQEKDPKKTSSCFSLSSRLLLYGRTLAGLRIYEAMRSLDYLLTREDVDSERIGSMGFSGGGMIASLTSALDDRIKATVICAYTSSYRGSLLSMNHCIDNYLPSILPAADLPELIGLIAPRALFVESGIDDTLFPVSSVREATGILGGIYESEGAEEQFAVDIFPGKHEVSGRKSFDWLADRLKV